MLQWSWLWPCPQILRPDWKGFPRTNPLAYYASSSETKEKSFITLAPGCRWWSGRPAWWCSGPIPATPWAATSATPPGRVVKLSFLRHRRGCTKLACLFTTSFLGWSNLVNKTFSLAENIRLTFKNLWLQTPKLIFAAAWVTEKEGCIGPAPQRCPRPWPAAPDGRSPLRLKRWSGSCCSPG